MKLKNLFATTATVIAGSFALAACGAGPDEPSLTTQPTTGTSTATETVTPTEDTKRAAASSIDADPVAGGEFNTEPTEKFGESGPAELKTTDIRVGSHDGYDRLVIEFEGTGTPEFHAGYSDDPRQQASGNPLDVPGAAPFELVVHGTSLDMSMDAKYAGQTDLGLASGSISSVVNGGTFEANSQYFVGLDSQRPYKVTALENPTRLVVDFQK